MRELHKPSRFRSLFHGRHPQFWQSRRTAGVKTPRPWAPSGRPVAVDCRQRPSNSGATWRAPGQLSAAPCRGALPSLHLVKKDRRKIWMGSQMAAPDHFRTQRVGPARTRVMFGCYPTARLSFRIRYQTQALLRLSETACAIRDERA
jgi:hypothetical protein